jgi:hypothetical protein
LQPLPNGVSQGIDLAYLQSITSYLKSNLEILERRHRNPVSSLAYTRDLTNPGVETGFLGILNRGSCFSDDFGYSIQLTPAFELNSLRDSGDPTIQELSVFKDTCAI